MGADKSVAPGHERDKSIDLLRCFALLGIILAHVSPPSVVLQLRGFDVPLMVFLSGVVFYRGKGFRLDLPNLLQYWFRRIKRIVFPVWLFLILYYGLMFLLFAKSPSVSEALEVFSLRSGWYVWIFRVFLIVALVAPFLTTPVKKWNSALLYLGGVLVLLMHEFIAGSRYPASLYPLVEAVPYVIVFLFGMLAKGTSRKQLTWMTFAWMAVFAGLAVWKFRSTGQFVNTGTCKYPPQLYYLAYGLGCIGVLWLVKDGLMALLGRIPFLEKPAVFIGSHTMWIYLWHILFLEFMSDFCVSFAGAIRWLHLPFWGARFVFVLTCSCILTFLQSLLFDRLKSACPDNRVVKWFHPILVG